MKVGDKVIILQNIFSVKVGEHDVIVRISDSKSGYITLYHLQKSNGISFIESELKLDTRRSDKLKRIL